MNMRNIDVIFFERPIILEDKITYGIIYPAQERVQYSETLFKYIKYLNMCYLVDKYNPNIEIYRDKIVGIENGDVYISQNNFVKLHNREDDECEEVIVNRFDANCEKLWNAAYDLSPNGFSIHYNIFIDENLVGFEDDTFITDENIDYLRRKV